VSSEFDARFRLRLAKGFQEEAQQDYQLRRWRSCVDNAQLSVENSGKAIIALFEPVQKTHNPANQLREIIEKNRIDAALLPDLQTALTVFDELGFAQHFMTDYGDEEGYRDPWSIFSEADALKSLETVSTCLALAERFFNFYHPESDSTLVE